VPTSPTRGPSPGNLICSKPIRACDDGMTSAGRGSGSSAADAGHGCDGDAADDDGAAEVAGEKTKGGRDGRLRAGRRARDAAHAGIVSSAVGGPRARLPRGRDSVSATAATA